MDMSSEAEQDFDGFILRLEKLATLPWSPSLRTKGMLLRRSSPEVELHQVENEVPRAIQKLV